MNKNEFKTLLGYKRIEIFIHKYLWECIFIVYIIFLLGSLVYFDYFIDKPVLNIEMIDSKTASTDPELFNDFLLKQGMNPEAEYIELNQNLKFNDFPDEIKRSFTPLLTCKIASETTDLYFFNDDNIKEFLARMDLCDLRTVLPPEFLSLYKNCLVYSGPILQGGFPCGIQLDQSSWIGENGFYNKCIIGISKNAKNIDLAFSFIEYIL